MQCIERITGGFQRGSASVEVCEEHGAALSRSWIPQQLDGGAAVSVVVCKLDMVQGLR
jgi:hypothetical protein